MTLQDDQRPPGLFETALYAGIEKAINTALRHDPATRQKLSEFSGLLIGITLRIPPVSAYMLIIEDGIEIYHSSEAETDIAIYGTPVELAAHLLNWKSAPGVIGGPVTIQGDQDKLQALIDIFRQLELDWGALFAPLMGNELAQQLDYGARRFFNWAGGALQRFTETTQDFLRQETSVLALRRDVYEFCQDVDEIRMDTDRLQARIEQLKRLIAARQVSDKPGSQGTTP